MISYHLKVSNDKLKRNIYELSNRQVQQLQFKSLRYEAISDEEAAEEAPLIPLPLVSDGDSDIPFGSFAAVIAATGAIEWRGTAAERRDHLKKLSGLGANPRLINKIWVSPPLPYPWTVNVDGRVYEKKEKKSTVD